MADPAEGPELLRTDVVALYVDPRGPYPTIVRDWYDEARDARTYDGDRPVVAHPPCARWCKLAKFVASQGGLPVGADGGLFADALATVRRCGGVLEHPAWSLAWPEHGLIRPPADGWQQAIDKTWCCEVSQAAYGHRAEKLTWLYYVGDQPPQALDWSRPEATAVVSSCTSTRDGGYQRAGERGKALLYKTEASRTPYRFAELLVSLAAAARKELNNG